MIAIAAAGIVIARSARVAANAARPKLSIDRPYAPSPTAAPILALGYREMAADLMFVRMVGYFPDRDSEPEATAAIAEAIVALDPQFRRAYEFGAIALTDARRSQNLALQLRAIALLERGASQFPTSYRFPMLAGQIYIGDLATDDPAQRRQWNEKGTLLLESASRKPGAPAGIGMIVAGMRTKLGQHQRAIASLRELFQITTDAQARREILTKLAGLEASTNAGELAAELLERRRRFEEQWKRERPSLPVTMFILIGPRIAPGFDRTELATGGRDVISTDDFEQLDDP